MLTADHAPHRLRWLVDGSVDPRTGRAVPRLRRRRRRAFGRSAAGAAVAVRRIRAGPARIDGRRQRAPPSGLLALAPDRRAGDLGAADRQAAPGRAELQGRDVRNRAAGRGQRRAGRTGPARARHAVHGADRGAERAAVALQ
ncbi:hypothetical protein CLOSS21_00181, partial [Clostridium sp. SS2/1]